MRPRKLFVEVAWLSGRRFGILEQESEAVKKRMLHENIREDIVDDVIDCLLEQRADPIRFPNVILCLDDEGNEIHFLNYFANCKKRN